MKVLLDEGADPNVRLKKKSGFSGYNFDRSGLDEAGATPFWRAAYGGDVPAMQLLESSWRGSEHSDHGASGTASRGKPGTT